MLAENLKRLRKSKGLSQEALAERLHVTRQTISKWENGLSVPDADLLIRLAEILEVTAGDLLGGPVEPPEDQDQMARQLEQLNLLLAERNRRSRRIWRVAAGILIAFAAFLLLTFILGTVAFQSFHTQTQEPQIVQVTSVPEEYLE